VTTEVPSFDLSPAQLALIGEVGAALFEGRALQASLNGLISIGPLTQSSNEKGNEHVERQGSRGSTTEPRERRQGTPPTSDSSRSVLERRNYRAQVAQIGRYYPGTRVWIRDDATWLAVPCCPLGQDGPWAKFLIAIPKRQSARLLAWGFWHLGDRVHWIGHRHTNYPDGSICAFPADGSYWRDGDPLCLFVDRLSEWAFRQLYYVVHHIWPGPQEGRWRYYRLASTQLGECCPRCRGLTSYETCCRAIDEAESRPSDRREFIAEVGCDIGGQHPHDRLIAFAAGERSLPPRIAYVHPDARRKAWSRSD
jgi:hypothetical protein